MLSAKVYVSPQINPETERFWSAANEGQLLLKRCLETGKAFYPPRTHSPFTGLAKTEWFEASGTGTLYSFSVTQRDGAPHCIAYVELAEGPIILSAMTQCEVDDLQIGQKVRAVFVSDDKGQSVPLFSPAD
jgi:uncharacterized OB-fold protein